MELLDRYLNMIRWQLPKAERDDIAAELKDVLLSKIEDREAALGRPLTTEEVDALLHAFGHPMEVASRYRKRQHLIGPTVLPFYELALRAAGALVLLIGGVTLFAGLVAGKAPGQAITQAMAGAWSNAVYFLGMLTVAAIILEECKVKLWNRRWRIQDFPKTAARRRPSRWELMFELAVGILAVLWWSRLVPFPDEWLYAQIGADFRIDPAPVWATLYTPVLAFLIVTLIPKVLELVVPAWVRLRGAATAAAAVLGLYLGYELWQAGWWIEITGGEGAAQLAEALNLSLKITVIICLIVSFVHLLKGVWLLAKGSDIPRPFGCQPQRM